MILSSRQISILSTFFPDAQPRTATEIGESSDYSHERVYSTLKELEGEGIVTTKAAGKTLLYSIKNFNMAYMAYIQRALQKKDEFGLHYPHLVRALDEFYKTTNPNLLVVFGSYARFQPTKNSDLDVLCVNAKKGQSERGAAEIGHRYGIRLSSVAIPSDEFSKIKEDNPELWNSIKLEGIVWKGHEFFYDHVYR